VDGMLDSCMNYPFRTAILNFLRGADEGYSFQETVMTIAENYPPQVLLCNMNLLGTHDTPRILTALVDNFTGSRQEYAARQLSESQREQAKNLLLMASFLQYTLPGAPSIYYGDEAGMEGFADPFNRRTFPWGKEDSGLLAHYRRLGELRKNKILQLGDIRFFLAQGHILGFSRTYKGQELRIYVNRSNEVFSVPRGKTLLEHGLSGQDLAPMGFCIMEV